MLKLILVHFKVFNKRLHKKSQIKNSLEYALNLHYLS